MENYFIIHGSFGSPFGNWFSWVQDFISTDGKQVYVPQFPIGVDYQNYENWSKLLKYYLDLGLTMYFDNLEDVKQYANEIICFYSDNDPYVKYEVEKDFANKIATEQILIPNAGHINSESGYDTFEDIVNYI